MFRTIGLLILLCASAAQAAMPARPANVQYFPGFDRARIVSEDVLVIRTFTSAMSDRKEYAGARCQAISDEFEIAFITPATLTIPRIHERPSDLRIACQSHNGNGQLTIRPTHPDHALPTFNPLATLAFAFLATTQKHNRDDWTYVPAGQMRTVTLQWATRDGR